MPETASRVLRTSGINGNPIAAVAAIASGTPSPSIRAPFTTFALPSLKPSVQPLPNIFCKLYGTASYHEVARSQTVAIDPTHLIGYS